MKNKFLVPAIVSVIVFVILELLGVAGPHFMSNQVCYALLGCNAGFFGYDTLVHFSSGVMEICLFFAVSHKFPALNIFKETRWQQIIGLILLAALIGVLWEFFEFGFDSFRAVALHMNLMHPVNRMAQPSNADTMGDIFCGLVGATIASIVYNRRKR